MAEQPKYKTIQGQREEIEKQLNHLAGEWRPINMTGLSVGQGGAYLVVLLEKVTWSAIHEVVVEEANPLLDVR